MRKTTFLQRVAGCLKHIADGCSEFKKYSKCSRWRTGRSYLKLIDINLQEGDIRQFLAEVVQFGGKNFARAAPLSIEVHHYLQNDLMIILHAFSLQCLENQTGLTRLIGVMRS